MSRASRRLEFLIGRMSGAGGDGACGGGTVHAQPGRYDVIASEGQDGQTRGRHGSTALSGRGKSSLLGDRARTPFLRTEPDAYSHGEPRGFTMAPPQPI